MVRGYSKLLYTIATRGGKLVVPGGQSDCSQSPCRKKTTTSGHFRDGSVRAEDILELTNRLLGLGLRDPEGGSWWK